MEKSRVIVGKDGELYLTKKKDQYKISGILEEGNIWKELYWI